jgi:hypothetical protein
MYIHNIHHLRRNRVVNCGDQGNEGTPGNERADVLAGQAAERDAVVVMYVSCPRPNISSVIKQRHHNERAVRVLVFRKSRMLTKSTGRAPTAKESCKNYILVIHFVSVYTGIKCAEGMC